ncbi:MAG TPA: formate dehydrogenase accessory sulfurtransferase FdhD [Phycisphaerae bacterium]|nr:formate dehydrogenase accessory sulfurtransferase FdhD [Phycisphaerae bacterium]HUT58278.1 formate dehydrogenase accessory sulfurtransferase FdhD [Phycisphaerae bacterium]
MDPVQECPIFRFDAQGLRAQTDKVIVEVRAELDVNEGQCRLAMLCLPLDLEALAVGLLWTEGLLRRRADLASVQVADQHRILVRGDFDSDALQAAARRWTWGSGCGGGGTSRDFDAPAYGRVEGQARFAPERLLELADDFAARARLWPQTGGVHACALASAKGIALFAEDVGRHNAFDKVMGRALLDGIDVSDKAALLTGRLSGEIVSKAVACRVPILVSRSAVTSLGVELARRFGVTLVGFARGRRFNVYAGFDRVAGADERKGPTP